MNNIFYLDTANLPISPPVKTFMILTHININLELLLKMTASKIRMWAEEHP